MEPKVQIIFDFDDKDAKYEEIQTKTDFSKKKKE